jgi:hypothetical protein
LLYVEDLSAPQSSQQQPLYFITLYENECGLASIAAMSAQYSEQYFSRLELMILLQ